jgi:hypothetical protein
MKKSAAPSRNMSRTTASESLNPALQPFGFLVGEWTTVGSHPMLPGKTFHGRTSFDWLEGGAFLMMRSKIDEPDIPDGIAIFGSDDARGTHHMLYFDERGVSRRYEVSIGTNGWRWWRDAPGFAQRYDVRVVDGGTKMVGEGELCRDGSSWEKDLALTYSRVR